MSALVAVEELSVTPAYKEEDLANPYFLNARLLEASKMHEFPGLKFLCACFGDWVLRSAVMLAIKANPQWKVTIEGGCLVATNNTFRFGNG